MKYTARLLLFFVLSLFVFVLPANAQENQYLAPNTQSNVPQNLHTYSQNVLLETLNAVGCLLTGIDAINPKQPCLGAAQNGQIGFVKSDHGLIGAVSGLTVMLYTPPVETNDFIKDMASHFGPAPRSYAQAQGIGLSHLSPIYAIWAGFRNVVYLMFILVFIILGFAIMLRLRIDPRTVMTIQNQIPRIIVGLTLVTFSIAIAGLLIDLMYAVIYLLFEIMKGIDPGIVGTGLQTNFQDNNPLGYANQLSIKGTIGIPGTSVNMDQQGLLGIISRIAGSTFSIVQNILDNTVGNIIATMFGIKPDTPFLGGVVSFLGGAVDNFAAGLAALVVFLIVAIALFVALIKTWFMLLQTYVMILLHIVLAPFWIVLALMPGGRLGFGGWLRTMVANLSVFPSVVAMFLMAEVFIDMFSKPVDNNQIFVPPLIGNPNGTAIGAFIGLGFIMMTPKVADMIRNMLKTPGAGMGSQAMAGLGVGMAPVMGGLGNANKLLFGRGDYTHNSGIVRQRLLRGAQTLQNRYGWADKIKVGNMARHILGSPSALGEPSNVTLGGRGDGSSGGSHSSK